MRGLSASHGARRVVLLALLLVCGLLSPALAQTADVLRGRVVGPDSSPIANAQVVALDTASKTPHPTRTDARGAYTISIDNGGGTYVVAVTMLGYAPQRRTVTRPASGAFPPIDFKLALVAAQLGAVRTTGERPKVTRSDVAGDNSIGGQTAFADATSGRNGDFTGDLTLALTSIPGVTIIPSATGGLPTVSAFGISGDQNGLILNGMGFGGSIPRDGMRVAVVTSSYDPSKGGFAGIQTSVRMSPGSNLKVRNLHATLDAPSLQWTTPVANRLQTRYDQQIFSGALSGPIVNDKLFYSTSFQVQRRASGLTSLSSSDPTSLAALRISSDSVGRLLNALGATGIPVNLPGVPSGRENREVRLAGRFDFIPNPAPPIAPGIVFIGQNGTQDAYYLQAGGTMRNNDGAMIGPTSVPSFGSEQTHRDGWVQLTAAKYLPRNILNETTVSFSGSSDRTAPYLDLPAARILVASSLANGELGLSTLQVGGNSQPRSDFRNWQTEIRNQASWNTWDRRHSISLTLSGSEDGYSVNQNAGYGTFVYNSLADFSAGTPASFSRTLSGRVSSGHAFSGAIGIGDTYQLHPTVQNPQGIGFQSPPTMIQYGLRLEGNHFSSMPGYNRLVDSVFGRRTDHVPSTIALTPMLGFRTYFGGPTVISGITAGPRGTLSGGVRQYRGSIAARTLESYARQTGLPDATLQLYCVGSATPGADWRSFQSSASAIPSECANGSAATVLAQTAPPVALYARDYQMFSSWRPQVNASWSFGLISVGGGATLALNRNVPGVFDVNFSNAPRFALASEGGRPVYVSASSIVPTTGAEAWTESRVSQLFGHVAESRSDLRSETRTINANVNFNQFILSPFANSWNGTLGYAYSDSREQYRGFLGTTDGDPTTVGWSRGAQAQHVFTLNVTRRMYNVGNLALFGRVQSGAFYTPTIVGDVNGDGYSNDRAFVFSPATAGDTALSNGITRLLNGSSGARNCLRGQLGTIAGRNSCTGPWSFSNLSLSFSPDAYRFGMGNRGSMTFAINNILSGVDQLVHGNEKLHGWGQPAFVDPTLLTVRGYDAMAQRFRYAVNPQFGSTSVFRNTFRQPFMLTIDFRIDVAPDRETQMLKQLLTPAKQDKTTELNETQIRAKIMRGFDPVNQIVMVRDSLKLTDAQVDSMRALGKRNMFVRDSIAGEVAKYLVKRKGNYAGAEVRDVWHTAGVATYTSYFRTMKGIIDVLTPEQRERSTHVPQTQGLVLQISLLREDQLPALFRTPLTTLP